METVYKEYLFDKHILVSSGEEHDDEYRLNVIISLGKLFGIRIIKGKALAEKTMIGLSAKKLGENVPQAFYQGFPESVRKLTHTELVFDQFVHYVKTYGLGWFDEPGHSLFDRNWERTVFSESVQEKQFTIITEEEAVKLLQTAVADLLAGTRPLSDSQYELVKGFIEDYGYVPEKIASKNTCIRLLADTRDLKLVDFLYMSDVIKLADEINYRVYENTDLKKLNLQNRYRTLISLVMDMLFYKEKCDLLVCCEKKKIWNGLLHHIHYKAKCPEAEHFLNVMRGKDNLSAYSGFERKMDEPDVRGAFDFLRKAKGSGAVLRKLDYLISRCTSEEEEQYILDNLDSDNLIILIQLLVKYHVYSRDENVPRVFRFTKYNKLKIHEEDIDELLKRKSDLTKEQTEKLEKAIAAILKRKLAGRLGKVYIDPDMKQYALPVQENTSQGGFGVLARGSKLRLPQGKKIRAFTYWEKVNDIDLSVFGIADYGGQEEFSWRTMAGNQTEAVTYSGDQTSGYNGGSEFFDIDLDAVAERYPHFRYIILTNNVYSRVPFSQCVCRAGYMMRDVRDSGEIFEPKTVQSSFTVNCDSTFAYLFGIDLTDRTFVWLNMARNGEETVAGTTDMTFLTDYFHTTEAINMYTFFEMMASERAADPADADVIVTDKDGEYPEGAEVIREYDFDRIIRLMNQ
ncbi:MAG: hypothetical protein IJH99_07915 [Eubacterium sp.]|nr:hypothetical protein [Eubacterium sp.]